MKFGRKIKNEAVTEIFSFPIWNKCRKFGLEKEYLVPSLSIEKLLSSQIPYDNRNGNVSDATFVIELLNQKPRQTLEKLANLIT